ncbi:hypothetical protein [Larkinella terrae]|uniref:Uncharacterized protein n=1 Tax=Larkinella terrae TaxID=2025311 RepID=A0A7K0ER74_9BACT|nr:hypothetical protein [Larkinella terrae]MRS64272.1 hypothetical protein [Larkinella terrae]
MEETHNNAVSETYRKYLIKVKLNEAFYYMMWGTDMADSEQQDKLLLDPENRILLFSRIDQIADFIAANSISVFDESNFHPWLAALTGSDAYTAYDLDYLQTLLSSALKEEQILQNPDITSELIGFFNLYGDYAYQLEEDFLFKPYRKPQLQLFFDYCYDTFFWSIPPDKLTRRQAAIKSKFRFSKFKTDMLRLLTIFISRCRLIT